MIEPAALAFAEHGAQRLTSVLPMPDLMRLQTLLGELPPDRAGIRLRGIAGLQAFLMPTSPIGEIAAAVLGSECRPVRAVLFDKTPSMNWALGWHQDRTIAVVKRRDVGGYGPWTVKDGLAHVMPPADLLSRMVTLRMHLDRVTKQNAPLLVAPGSHQFGRIPVAEVPVIVKRCGISECIADAGDVWLYATPILHASGAAIEPLRRRVLQVDYAAEELPGGLTWHGV